MLADVPVPHVVEVGKAHIVCVDIADLLASDLDITADVILGLHTVLAWLILSLNLVCLICQCDLASQLVTHVAHKDIEDVIACVVVLDGMTILEDDLFAASCSQIARLKAYLDAVLRPTSQLIVAIWAIDDKVRDRWVMASLFHED